MRWWLSDWWDLICMLTANKSSSLCKKSNGWKICFLWPLNLSGFAVVIWCYSLQINKLPQSLLNVRLPVWRAVTLLFFHICSTAASFFFTCFINPAKINALVPCLGGNVYKSCYFWLCLASLYVLAITVSSLLTLYKEMMITSAGRVLFPVVCMQSERGRFVAMLPQSVLSSIQQRDYELNWVPHLFFFIVYWIVLACPQVWHGFIKCQAQSHFLLLEAACAFRDFICRPPTVNKVFG